MMTSENAVWVALLICFVNYYITTFTVWFGHWLSHLKGNPLAGFHVGGHHAIYFNSKNILSEVFRYGSGKHGSNFALIPPLVLQVVLQYMSVPLWMFLICLIQTISLAVVIGYIHIQMHIRGSKLESFQWFLRARDMHSLHHDLDVNYMVTDHFWDKVFRTYVPSKTTIVKAEGAALSP